MCGIAGIVFEPSPNKLQSIGDMAATLLLRGPDDHGTWTDTEKGVALGFRRLAIVDLSQAGHQPMHSNRFVVVFNGEIYNFKELSEELRRSGWVFYGNSDTEVLLASIETWGVQKSLEKFNGMFAFALWDKQDDVLYLARDRFGEKPLYWGWQGKTLLFGSELKALKKYKGITLDIDRQALNLFMRYSYIPAPYTIYKNIEKIEPGTYLRIHRTKKVEKFAYWSAQKVARTINKNNETLGEQEALETLEAALKKSTSLRSIADVPLGTFLSGGIDSSLITSLLQSTSSKPVNTFTIGFCEKNFNEAPYAKAISDHLSTNHTELYITNEHALEVIPKLPFLYDEPFADSSQIPTYLISHLARQSVTVCLSGDGGDELFGGYNRYTWGARLYTNISRCPLFVRKKLLHFLGAIDPDKWENMYDWLESYLPTSVKTSALRNKIVKMQDALHSTESIFTFYRSLASIIKDPDRLVLKSHNGYPMKELEEIDSGQNDIRSWMMMADLLTYLPGDILTKVDRASMGNSLEVRVPFLDPHVFEVSLRLPEHLKIHNNKGKIALRQLLYKYVPKHLIERPKTGFGVPIGAWLKDPLKGWASDLLNNKSLDEQGFLNASVVKNYLDDHLLRNKDRTHELWNILMFQSWLLSS